MDNPKILELFKSVKYPGFTRDIVSFGIVKEMLYIPLNVEEKWKCHQN